MNQATLNDVIKVGKSQVGYLEKKSNKDLDHFTKNAGSNNYTKYARDFLVFTKLNLQAQAWCAMFICWCFVQAFGEKKAKELLGGFSAYTPTSAQYFKNMKQWHISNPKVGDLIYFKNSERINHIGLVTKVTSTTVYTIEGNTSSGNNTVIENGGGVWEKQYLLNNPRIAGYGRPKYDNSIISNNEPSNLPQKPLLETNANNDYKGLKIKNIMYTVVKGNTLSAIAKANATSISNLKEWNKLTNINNISIGQKLIVGKFIEYKVKSGDNLSKISREFLDNMNKYIEIKKFNGLKNDLINVGQVLKIRIE